jgi:peptide-methionine (S)-S-oxide reductase
MSKSLIPVLLIILLICGAGHAFAAFPDPMTDVPETGEQKVVLAGGCFWGIEAVFKHTKGVTKAISGYTGGSRKTANYGQVSLGGSGHAESVEVTYDPSEITFGQILKIFFSVAHDPTQVNRQGPDIGTQYRSGIFFTTPAQEKTARKYIEQLQLDRIFANPVVTQVAPLVEFFPAEDYHQDYVEQHKTQPYILINDLPKLVNLQRTYPDYYKP